MECAARAMVRALVVWLGAALMAGCGGTAQRTDVAAPGGSGELARPAVELAGLGLEVRGWVVDNRDGRLARALSEREMGAALGSAGDEAWRSCGLRVIEVPVEELPGLHARLATGPEQRMWLGQTVQWSPAYSAAETGRSTGVRMPEGELLLEPGVLRLLVRAWVERGVSAGGAGGAGAEWRRLRVDVLPQNRERFEGALTLDPVDPTKPLETGLVFERLRSTWMSDGSRALLLAPAPPEEDWQALARVVGPLEDGGVRVGPFGAPLPTLGESLLGTGREGFRIVLVLIPRTSVESPAGR